MVFSWLNLAVIVFLCAGLAFALGPIILSLLVAPRSKGGSYSQAYECGMPVHGQSWVRFGITYYFYALLFLAFDVDVLYLFPVAVHYPQSQGWLPFWQVLVFILVLALAVAYFWRKGVFTWPRRIRAAFSEEH